MGTSSIRHISDYIRQTHQSCLQAIPNLWFKAVVRLNDGAKSYAHLMLYVDHCFSNNYKTMAALQDFWQIFPNESWIHQGPPWYVIRLQASNGSPGQWCACLECMSKQVMSKMQFLILWIHIEHFTTLVARNWGETSYLVHDQQGLHLNLMRSELNPEKTNCSPIQARVIDCIVEPGRVDIITEVST